MSLNKVNRASTSSVNGLNHCRTNGSRFSQDQNEPRVNDIPAGSKSDGCPQSRDSKTGGLNSRGANSNQPTHQAPLQRDSSDAPGWTGKSEPNFLDWAFEESDEESDDEWEEVICTANNVAEDQQPPSLPSASHTNNPRIALPGDLDHRSVQELAGEQGNSLDGDLQLKAELAEGLFDLNTPIPGPSQKPRSRTFEVANTAADTPSSSQPPVHLRLEVAEHPSSKGASVKGKGRIAYREPTEQPHKVGKQTNPPRVSPITEDPPTRKPIVSFKEKATELARSTGRLLAPSKLLPPCNPTAILPFSTTEGSSALNNPPHLRAQATSDPSRPTSQLFRSKAFSDRIQILREKQTVENLRRFHERYGGIIVDNARRDLVELTVSYTGSVDPPKGRQPTQRRRVQRTADGKRASKAQARAEEVMKICRTAKSYIVDAAAIKRREVPTPPEPQCPTPTITPSSTRPHFIRSGKPEPTIASQQVSRTQPTAPSPAPQPSPAPSGSVTQGLKFTRKQKPAQKPGEIATETAGRVTSSERNVCGRGLASASGNNDPLTIGVSKRRLEGLRWEPEGSFPQKKPRLCRS